MLELKDICRNYRMELIFVDDGSGDNSLKILLDFQSKYPEIIKVVKLTRNFGSMAAIQAGFSVAGGDCIGMIATDLQDPLTFTSGLQMTMLGILDEYLWRTLDETRGRHYYVIR